jgi:hypothetical protein
VEGDIVEIKTAPLAIHRRDKTTAASLSLSPGPAARQQSISSRLQNSTRRVNCVASTPTPANVNIHYTQGRQNFNYYLVGAGSYFPVRQISVPHLMGDAFFSLLAAKIVFLFFSQKTGLH